MSALRPVGRFAPSPTGNLHIGSLCTAIASYCHIKSLGGRWLVRLEDTDFERCQPKYVAQIERDLANLGLWFDGSIIHQSKRLPIYNDAIHALSSLIYPCRCSRKQLESFAQENHIPADRFIYPRFCLSSKPIQHIKADDKLRLQLPDVQYVFNDELLGIQWQNPQKQLGDVIIKRNNQIINYIWAAAIDDGLQQITHVLRGQDILPMTMAQIHIQKLLKLSTVQSFAHLPLIINTQGQKLSKQNLATPIDTSTPDKCRHLLLTALRLLGQPILPNLDFLDILPYAIQHWQSKPLQYKQTLAVVQTNSCAN